MSQSLLRVKPPPDTAGGGLFRSFYTVSQSSLIRSQIRPSKAPFACICITSMKIELLILKYGIIDIFKAIGLITVNPPNITTPSPSKHRFPPG